MRLRDLKERLRQHTGGALEEITTNPDQEKTEPARETLRSDSERSLGSHVDPSYVAEDEGFKTAPGALRVAPDTRNAVCRGARHETRFLPSTVQR